MVYLTALGAFALLRRIFQGEIFWLTASLPLRSVP